jgi:hypothetical protein
MLMVLIFYVNYNLVDKAFQIIAKKEPEEIKFSSSLLGCDFGAIKLQ